MRSSLLFLFLVTTFSSFGQLIDGTLVNEKRKLITETNFKITNNNEGVVYYELAINRKGIVTSAKLLEENTTVISTPTKMKVREYVMTLKFEEGTYYPEFHHVRVKVTVEKEVQK